MFKNYYTSFIIIPFVFLAYLLHKTIFEYSGISDKTFVFSLEILYIFFTIFSIIITNIVVFVKNTEINNVGMSFMVATTIKIGACYLMLRPILQNTTEKNTTEKINFLCIFLLFLAIETVFTIYILNKIKSN